MAINENNKILLCTIIPFSPLFLDRTLDSIQNGFQVEGKINVLKSTSDPSDEKFILMYNIIDDGKVKYKDIVPSTFRIHRNTKTGTLYTINALNEVIRSEGGDPEKKEEAPINWENYRNSLILLKKDGGDENKKIINKIGTVIWDQV